VGRSCRVAWYSSFAGKGTNASSLLISMAGMVGGSPFEVFTSFVLMR
jgi:hypothetical protein